MRPLVSGVLIAVASGCVSFPNAHLVSQRERLLVQRADLECGPIGFRRVALGARWGEYLRVTVNAPFAVAGDARLFVDGRAQPLRHFDTQGWGVPEVSASMLFDSGLGFGLGITAAPMLVSPHQAVVIDEEWSNERIDVASALPKDALLDVSLDSLASALAGNCEGVTFTVEQGVLRPTIDEGAWVAELTRRGGPELQAWIAAKEQRAEEIRREHVALVEARHAAEREGQAERLVIAEQLRQQHYAAWEARRAGAVHVPVAEVAASVEVAQVPCKAPVAFASWPTERTFVAATAAQTCSSTAPTCLESWPEEERFVARQDTEASSAVVETNVGGVTNGAVVANGTVATNGSVAVETNVSVASDASWVAEYPSAQVDASWVASYPQQQESEWSLPRTMERVPVSTTLEMAAPSQVVTTPAPVVAEVHVDPFFAFMSAVASAVLTVPPPVVREPVHQAVPVQKR